MTLRDKKSEALFQFAQYDAAAAEKSGYSNYSYWRSTLSVFLHNRAAVALYTKLGFAEEGRRKNYYTDPTEDALLLTRRFKKEGNL